MIASAASRGGCNLAVISANVMGILAFKINNQLAIDQG